MTNQTKPISFTDTEKAYAHLSNKKLLKIYRVYKLLSNKFFVNVGTVLVKIANAIYFPLKPFVKNNFYNTFCGGESLRDCTPTINLLQQRGVNIDLNYSVETKHSEKEFDKTFSKLKGAIEFASRKSNVNVICCKPTGLGKHEIIEKFQKEGKLSKNEQAEFIEMTKRMDNLCSLAKENDIKIYWDAEESWVQKEIDNLVNALMKKYNKEKAVVFNTYQMYRVDKLGDLKNNIQQAKEQGYYFGVKMVRGAYVDKENDWAKEHGVPTVIQKSKQDTDNDFNAAISLCLDNIENLSLCIASHNEQSNFFAAQLMTAKNIVPNHPNIEFSQLYGMGDFITFNLAENGYNASKYLPFGPVREVIPYLIRRADENKSVNGQTGRELEMLTKEKKRRQL